MTSFQIYSVKNDLTVKRLEKLLKESLDSGRKLELIELLCRYKECKVAVAWAGLEGPKYVAITKDSNNNQVKKVK